MTAATRTVPSQATGATLPYNNAKGWQDIVHYNVAALWKYIAAPLTSIGGTANAITATSDTSVVAAISAYSAGQKFTFTAASANTGGVTINIDGVGVKDIKDFEANTLQGGDIASDGRYLIEYDGTQFRLIGGSTGSSGRPSTAPDMILQDQKSQNTAGGTFTSGAWQTRTLNTAVRSALTGGSLSSNQITLPAGTYYVEWGAPAYNVDGHQSRLQNITDGTTVAQGRTAYMSNSGNNADSWSMGEAYFTITSAKVYELQHRAITTQATFGLSRAANLATEVYSWVRIWKVGALAIEVDGVDGGGVSFQTLFSTTTADADPGSGTLRLNNATQGSATQAFVDLLDANAVDVTNVLDSLDASSSTVKGTLRLVKYDDKTKWIVFSVTARTTATGYRKFSLTFVAQSGSNPFANGDRIVFTFSRTGDAGAGGTLANIRLAKTANYTLANADKTKTVALGGTTFFTLTVNAASGYDSDFTCLIVNEDTGRAKALAINGLTTFQLWPLQSVILFNQNNTWQVKDYAPRWRLLSSTTVYVDGTNGNDANDGLASGSGNALATIQAAVNQVARKFDLNGNSVTIQVANGTYAENVVAGYPWVGPGDVTLQGDTATPSNVLLQPASGIAFQVGASNVAATNSQCGVAITIQGFKTVTSNTHGLVAADKGTARISAMDFGAAGTGSHMQCTRQGGITILGNYTISGGAANHWSCLGQAFLNCSGRTITLTGTPAFSGAFANVSRVGAINCPSNTFSGSATGSRYAVVSNSLIDTTGAGATYLPGDSAGSTATGGQYI